jgi:drug/metabolite transporter (DMT)-like permease
MTGNCHGGSAGGEEKNFGAGVSLEYDRPLHPPHRPPVLPYVAIGFAVLVWGASFVAARHLLKPEGPDRAALSPVTLAAARFSIASIFFALPFALALIRRELTARDLLRLALLGQLAFSTYFWLQYTGVRNTNAGVAALLAVGLMPAATGVLAPLGGERRPSPRAWGALLLGFLGVAVLTLGRPGESAATGEFALGALCLAGNAFAFAAYSLLARRWMARVGPVALTGGAMIFGSIGLLAMCAISEPDPFRSLSSLDATQWGALAFLTLVCSIAGYFAWNFALSRVEASRAAVCIYAEPVVAVALGILWLGERHGATALAGAAAIAVSIFLSRK